MDATESDSFYLDGLSTETRRSRSCCNVVRSEFRMKNFGFGFATDAMFLSCQWPCPNAVFLIYRLLVAVYAVVITLFSIVRFDHDIWRLPWPVWLTNWSYFLLTCHLLCAAVILLLHSITNGPLYIHHRAPVDYSDLPCYLRLSWFLYTIAAPAAFIVTIVYFSAVFPSRHRDYISVEDLNLHLLNSVVVLLELTFNAFPVRLLHVIYVWLYGVVYILFSIVYWCVDHTNVMYPGVLDWNVPWTTVIVLIVLTLVGVPLLQLVLFTLYRLRLAVYRRCVTSTYF